MHVCGYCTTNIKMMSIGTVLNRTVYGNIELGIPTGLLVTKRTRMQKKTREIGRASCRERV